MAPRAVPNASLPQAGAWGTPAPLQVLVVDDDALVRETLAQIISVLHAGEVTEAASGLDAIRMISEDPERFDVIFCDLQMPGSDGLDVLEACAEVGMRSTVILMSGSGEHNLRAAAEEARDSGAALARTMAKPFSVAEVKAVLQAIAGRS